MVPVDAELIDSLLDETRHVGHLVDDLQDVALAEAGQLRLTIEPVDLTHLLANVVAAARDTARRRAVELVEESDRETVVAGDAVRLRQVFANLVHNALRHTPRGGTVRLAVETRDDAWARVTVTDTGEGIAAEHLPHIFDRFYRTDRARSRESGGTGLGLAICKHFVEAHGGSIEVTSEPGRGSTFVIVLPATDVVPSDGPGPRPISIGRLEEIGGTP